MYGRNGSQTRKARIGNPGRFRDGGTLQERVGNSRLSTVDHQVRDPLALHVDEEPNVRSCCGVCDHVTGWGNGRSDLRVTVRVQVNVVAVSMSMRHVVMVTMMMRDQVRDDAHDASLA